MTISNVKKIYIYRAFASFILVFPVFILFLQEKGLNMTQIMILQSVFTFGIMFFTIPAGLVADKIGRKPVMLVSIAIYSLSHVGYGLGNNFWEFFAIEILFAISVALWESTWQALIYDSLKTQKQEKQYKKILGNYFIIGGISVGAASVIGSFLADIWNSYDFLWLLSGLMIGFGFFAVVTIKEPKIKKEKSKSFLDHFKSSFKYVINHTKLKTLLIYSSMISVLTLSGFYLYQPYFVKIGLPITMFGIIFAIVGIMEGLGSKLSHNIEKIIGEKKSLILISILPTLFFLLLALSNSKFMMIFPILIVMVVGFKNTVISYYINQHVSSHHRATITSFSICLFSIFSAIIFPITGIITDKYSINMGFLFVSIVLLLTFLLAITNIIKNGD
jgi:MFS family permease